MRAHEAGALHGNDAAPQWLPYPTDVNHLIDGLWSTATERGADGALEVAGVSVKEIARTVGTPTFVIDEADFRSRAAAFRDAFAAAFSPLNGADMSYAGKAFLTRAVARWMREEGLGIDVCTGGELAVALASGTDPATITVHGNNKSDAEIARAIEVGAGRIVIDSLDEVARVDEIARTYDAVQPVLIRVTSGVEAHTHEFIATAHEDQKFGLSLATGDAFEAARLVSAAPNLQLEGLHSHIGSQIFDTHGFEVAARRVLALVAEIRERTGEAVDHLVLGGGFGVMYNTQHTPKQPAELADSLAQIVRLSCAELGIEIPRLGFEPGRAIAGPSTQTLYTVGTIKDVELGGVQRRLYVSVDGGMSDNLRTALYDADYSCLLSGRTSDATPRVVRIVGKHCESGDIVVKDEYLPGDVRRGDLVSVPVTGAYCASLASNYNHVPRPAVVSVKDGVITPMIRRETDDDLLARDLG
ncbi:MAG: diaminopimelate decarboxylase [Dermabacter sp.]|nr:diaminopimelate decarboxylase [Dermabacter sp.]